VERDLAERVDGSGRKRLTIYFMSAAGGDARRITKNDVWDLEPAWRP
jgi:hypothetical protein